MTMAAATTSEKTMIPPPLYRTANNGIVRDGSPQRRRAALIQASHVLYCWTAWIMEVGG